MRFDDLSYGELLVLSRSLLFRIRQLDGEIRIQLGSPNPEYDRVVRDKQTERTIAFEMLLEVGNLRHVHTEVDESSIIDL
jgi:hypothetical protein